MIVIQTEAQSLDNQRFPIHKKVFKISWSEDMIFISSDEVDASQCKIYKYFSALFSDVIGSDMEIFIKIAEYGQRICRPFVRSTEGIGRCSYDAFDGIQYTEIAVLILLEKIMDIRL